MCTGVPVGVVLNRRFLVSGDRRSRSYEDRHEASPDHQGHAGDNRHRRRLPQATQSMTAEKTITE